MDCKEAEELIEPYILGALDSGERSQVESHLETCRACGLMLRGEGETVADLAFAVPQLGVPARVKQLLLSRVEADLRRDKRTAAHSAPSRLRGVVGNALRARPALAATLLLVVGLVAGGIWFNGRLHQVSVVNEKQTSQLENVAEWAAYVGKIVSDQRYLSSMTAAPGVSVNMLRGTESTRKAWGMIACCAVSDRGILALLAVTNLPPLPPDKVYQVWLFKDGQRQSAGVFTVDATGFGQTLISPVAPFNEFDAIGVTIEPDQGSVWPTGTKVLDGDL